MVFVAVLVVAVLIDILQGLLYVRLSSERQRILRRVFAMIASIAFRYTLCSDTFSILHISHREDWSRLDGGSELSCPLGREKGACSISSRLIIDFNEGMAKSFIIPSREVRVEPFSNKPLDTVLEILLERSERASGELQRQIRHTLQN